MTAALQQRIEELWDRAAELSPADAEARRSVEEAIELLDRGEARVAEVGPDGEVVVHEWLKMAILLLFRLRAIETTEVGPFEYRRQAAPQARLRRGRRPGGARGLGPVGLVPRAAGSC